MSDFKIESDGDDIVIKINGDLVASLVEEMKPEIIELSSQGRKLLFDLDDVNMIDSIGIGFLVATHNSMVKIDKTIEVFNISPEILELFKSMRLDTHFALRGI